MMFKKLALLTVVGVFSSAANAGFFDSNDFKCGREDAVNALSEHIRSEASGLLQSDFLTKSKYTYDSPVSLYQSKLDSISIAVTNVSTGVNKTDALSCSATVSLTIPQETLDVVSNGPSYLRSVTGSYGKINKGSVVWKDVSYSAKLADNKKEIIFGDFNRTDIPDVMFNISVLAGNKDQIIKALSQGSLGKVQSAYARADRELNTVWKDLPASSRNALKKEQMAWVNDKNSQCGKITDAASEAIEVKQRISIYQCQTIMTNKRFSYLSGNNN